MTGGKRPRSGRKPVEIDLEQVEKLAGIQCTDEEIAAFLHVSLSTIERRKRQPAFAEALERGKSKGRVLFAAICGDWRPRGIRRRTSFSPRTCSATRITCRTN